MIYITKLLNKTTLKYYSTFNSDKGYQDIDHTLEKLIKELEFEFDQANFIALIARLKRLSLSSYQQERVNKYIVEFNSLDMLRSNIEHELKKISKTLSKRANDESKVTNFSNSQLLEDDIKMKDKYVILKNRLDELNIRIRSLWYKLNFIYERNIY